MGQPATQDLRRRSLGKSVSEPGVRPCSRLRLQGSGASTSGAARYKLPHGEVLADEQARAATKEDVLNALTQMATRFRSRVGESLSTVEKHDTPLAEATTPSLEASKAYSTAEKVHSSTGPLLLCLFTGKR